jgi:hypothetical protein
MALEMGLAWQGGERCDACGWSIAFPPTFSEVR